MTCEKYRLLVHDWMDGRLRKRDALAMAAHEANCPGCAAYHEEMRALLQALQDLDRSVRPPESFSAAWRQAIRQERAPLVRARHRLRSLAALAAALVCLIGGTSLMRAGYLPGTEAYEARKNQGTEPLSQQYFAKGYTLPEGGNTLDTELYAASEELQGNLPGDALQYADGAEGSNSLSSGIRVLRSGFFHLSTAKFDEDLQALLDQTEAVGGWVEHQSVSGEPFETNPQGGRYGSLTLRIPENELNGFVEAIASIGQVQSSELNAQDISNHYTDRVARLAQYEAQRDRLQELLSQATSVSEILEIEERLTEVQYEIDSLTSMIRGWDSRAQYAQIIVTLTETLEAAEPLPTKVPGLTQRMGEGLNRSLTIALDFLKDMAVFGAMALPWLAVAGGIGLILYGIGRVRRRKIHNE